MRNLTTPVMVIALLLVVEIGVADAQNYPWCSARGEGRNCGYVSREQCMASGSVGAYCEQNFLYRPDESRSVRSRPGRR
jgi:Protein of unknown function (DUF3551)